MRIWGIRRRLVLFTVTFAIALTALVGFGVFVSWMEVTERHFTTYDDAAKSGLVGEGRLHGWVPKTAFDIHFRGDVDSNEMWVAFKAPRETLVGRLRRCTAMSPADVTHPRYRPRGAWWPDALGPDPGVRSAALKYYRCERDTFTAVDEARGRMFEWRLSS
jgi:hypothetical protein